MQNTEINAGVIIAIVSLIGTIATTIVQYLRDRAQIRKESQAIKEEAKRDEATAATNIAEIALKLNRQEIDTLRQVVQDLKDRNTYLSNELTICQVDHNKRDREQAHIIQELEDKINSLENEIDSLNRKNRDNGVSI